MTGIEIKPSLTKTQKPHFHEINRNCSTSVTLARDIDYNLFYNIEERF